MRAPARPGAGAPGTSIGPSASDPIPQSVTPAKRWPALAIWLVAFTALALLDGRLDVANLALILVLAAAMAALWLRPLASVLASLAAVVAFNIGFVAPRGQLAVDLREHLLLLVTLLVVSILVALLMARQRQLLAAQRRQAQRIEQLRAFGEYLRDTEDAAARAGRLQTLLAALVEGRAAVLVARQAAARPEDGDSWLLAGSAGADEMAGLWLCLRECRPLGPGTGRHEEQAGWFLPLRGRHAAAGAALVLPGNRTPLKSASRDPAQLLCDQLGLAIERSLAAQAAAAARDEAQSLALRSTLLAAVAHDNRTPLATIVSAASSLAEQDERLGSPQRRRLAQRIVDEARQLGRLTDNALQLARLETPGLVLHADWESAEELVGAVLRRVRERYPLQEILTRVDPDLPLLRCDAVLIVQLIDNLVDNAIKYAGEHGPLDVEVACRDEGVAIAVRDRGPGVDPQWHERIFEVFQRGRVPAAAAVDAASRRGAGVGLAVCRAIAEAHGGRLGVRPRPGGGSVFECLLPVVAAPAIGELGQTGDDRLGSPTR